MNVNQQLASETLAFIPTNLSVLFIQHLKAENTGQFGGFTPAQTAPARWCAHGIPRGALVSLMERL